MKTLKSLALLMAIFPLSLFGREPLDIGAPAPALKAPDQNGAMVDFSDLYTKGPVVVYFYPRSDTPGCTKQACNIRDNYGDLQAAGVTILGVSTDDVAAQKAFEEKYQLPFTLVADKDKQVGEAFGVGGYLGLAYKRQTFLVVDGKIAWRDLSAQPTLQSQAILEALDALKTKAKE